MIALIDYGIGNIRSIEKAFEAVGADVVRTDRPADLARAARVVLPGVGAFGACAAEIRRRGLEAPIRAAIDAGKPFLGVCVGMQLLFDASEELGEHRGLGVLPGRVVRFETRQALQPVAEPGVGGVAEASAEAPEADVLKVPHMGWNRVTPTRTDPLLHGLEPGAFFYFVHSYHVRPDVAADVLATTPYGGAFPAVVQRNNVYGVQFHPEKSQRNGLQILKNFAER